jgi:hypothetical protein
MGSGATGNDNDGDGRQAMTTTTMTMVRWRDGDDDDDDGDGATGNAIQRSATADDNGNYSGALGTGNETAGGTIDEGAV